MKEFQKQMFRRDILNILASVYPAKVADADIFENPRFVMQSIASDDIKEELKTLLVAGFIADSFLDYPAGGHNYFITHTGFNQIKKITTLSPLIWGV